MERRILIGLVLSSPLLMFAACRDESREFVSGELSVEEYEAHFDKIWGQLTTREVPGRNAAYTSFRFGLTEPFVGSLVLVKGLRPADVSSVNSLNLPEKYPLSEESTAKTILYTLSSRLQLTVGMWDGQDPKRFGASREKGFRYTLNASERSYVIDRALKALKEKKEATIFKPVIFVS